MQEVDIVSFSFLLPALCQQCLLFSAHGGRAQHTKGEKSQADPKDLLSPLQEMTCTFHSILAEVELIEAILTKVS